jgi:hypothetical protein
MCTIKSQLIEKYIMLKTLSLLEKNSCTYSFLDFADNNMIIVQR